MQSGRTIRCKIYKIVVLFFTFFFLSGCANKKTVVNYPIKESPPKIAQTDNSNTPGSLYNGYDNLFSDDKAHNVGDIVTIKIYENISGQGSANTQANRSNNMNLNFPSATIMDKRVPDKTTVFGLNQSSTNSFSGSGDTRRKANLVATITARVVKVYPNGNLYISGKKYIKINDDVQILRISGIIKPNDITQDNYVDSSKISDMYVEYNGEGFMADNQSPGWLAKFLMKIWPF
ncbi:flagellar basal body L-ring protein FlgH [Nitrosophilus labii]|uniref:flagellar basal body L-ring protein FlgH n=1 Tax=Nitrosophilus labii TaxID=2706014 RepID=UPI001656E15D|nr:flagellar basal body L-ring protein FlgH [Nitrosophilus labii]